MRPATDDRPAFREWMREQISMKTYPRHSASHALIEAIRLAERLRSRGYFVDAADEFEFAAAILRCLDELPENLEVERVG